MSGHPPPGWQGPLRAAAAVFVVGFLVVWLVKPIGNPCPDLERLPQGSTASSSPSFSPPGSRTCTYTAAGGTQATSKYVPWLDWIVLLLLAAVVAGAVRALSPAGRVAGEGRPREGTVRAERPPRVESPKRAESPQRAEPQPHAERPPRVESPQRAEPQPRAERPPRVEPPPPAPPRAHSPGGSSERDAAERERARQERAARRRR